MAATSKDAPMDLAAALDRYTQQLAADGRSPLTADQYRRHVGMFARWLETENCPTDVALIGPEHVAGFLTSPALLKTAAGSARKATSANTARTSLRVFFKYVADAGLAPTNAARLVRLARTGAPPPRTLAEDAVKRLLAAVDADDGDAARRDGALVRLILGTGLRISSALELRVEDIDLDHGEMRVLRMKGDRPLTLPLSRQVVRELRPYLRRMETGLLFPGRRGRALCRRQAAYRINRWAAAAGVPGRACAHALRHSFGQRLYDRTRDIALVGAALGHRGPGTAAVYARVTGEALRAALR